MPRPRKDRDRARAPGRKEDRASPSTPAGGGWPATPLSLGLGGAGLVLAVVGFFLIARGEITLAPFLLVLAYLVLFPLALVYRKGIPRGG